MTPAVTTLSTPGKLVVVSYNVRRCIGRDGRCDPGRIAHVLRGLDAHLVGLQEVHAESRSGGDDQAAQVATELGCSLVRGPALIRPEGSYGNALLSRLPIDGYELLDLSVGGRCEARGAVDARVSLAATQLQVVVTHLGLRWWERRRQVTRLASAIKRASTPLIVLGDLNEWRPGAHRTLRRLDAGLGPHGRHCPRTFPACLPILRLDRILVRPARALIELEAIDTPLTRMASDHLPLRAVIDETLLVAAA